MSGAFPLTSALAAFRLGLMLRFRSFTAVLMALIWVPATMCCDLELAGAAINCCGPTTTDAATETCNTESDSCCSTEAPSEVAGCDNVAETGGYQNATPVLKLAPSLHLVDIIGSTLTLPKIEADTAPPAAWEKTRPPAWTTCWQFEQRAAPLAHAPDATRA